MKKIVIMTYILMSGTIHAANELDVTITDNNTTASGAGFSVTAGGRCSFTAEYTRKNDKKGKKKVKKEDCNWTPGHTGRTVSYLIGKNPPPTQVARCTITCAVTVEFTDASKEDGVDSKILHINHFPGPIVLAPVFGDVVI